MPMPSLMGKVNKRVFNPREIRKGERPVLIHRGRKSQKTYRTPLDAHPVDDGYVFILVYGATKSDWVQNILVAGEAVLRIDGQEIELSTPEVINRSQAEQILHPETKFPAGFLRVNEFLKMSAV